MRRALSKLFCAIALLITANPASAADDGEMLFDAPAMSEAELADSRGGFALPNGVEVALGVAISTAVNGQRLIETRMTMVGNRVEIGSVVNQALAEALAAETAAAKGAQPAMAAQSAAVAPEAIADTAPPVQTPQQVAAAAAPPAVTQVTDTGSSYQVSVTLPTLSVQHFVGESFGSIIANSGDGRVIDHSANIDISLSNAGPFMLGSAIFRVQNLGIESSIWRTQ